MKTGADDYIVAHGADAFRALVDAAKPIREAMAGFRASEAKPQPVTVTGSEPTFPEGVWCGTFAELDALDIPDPELLFTVAGIAVAAMETVIIRGPANVYKSFTALRALIQAAVDGHTVLLLEGEGSKGATRKRLRRLIAALGITDSAVLGRIHVVQGSFSLTENASVWAALLKRIKPAFVVLDPVVEYNDGDENSAQEMRRFTATAALAKAAGAAFIAVHHSTKPDKDGKSSMRGSSQLRGWVDHEIVIAETSDVSRVLITHAKCRERAREPVRSVFWSFTDETISMSVHAEAADAAETNELKHRSQSLLGIITEFGPISLAAAKTRLGKVSGTTFQKIVADLEKRRLVHRAPGRMTDAKGRGRSVENLYLGPASASGTDDLSRNDLSRNSEW